MGGHSVCPVAPRSANVPGLCPDFGLYGQMPCDVYARIERQEDPIVDGWLSAPTISYTFAPARVPEAPCVQVLLSRGDEPVDGDLASAGVISQMLDWRSRPGPFTIRSMRAYSVTDHEDLRKRVYEEIGGDLKGLIGEGTDYYPRHNT